MLNVLCMNGILDKEKQVQNIALSYYPGTSCNEVKGAGDPRKGSPNCANFSKLCIATALIFACHGCHYGTVH